MLKKLIAMLVSASMLLSSAVMISSYAVDEVETDDTTSNTEGYDNPDATETPSAPEASETPTEAPETATEAPNPEDGDVNEYSSLPSQLGGGVGAAGGLGFSGSAFPDCVGHWAEQTIISCVKKNYLNGYDDGSFRPDNPVSAAEFAKIYSAWQNKFYTVSSGYWAMPFVRDMLESGIFEKGDFDDYSAYMTREACSKAIINSLKGEYFPANLDEYAQYITDYELVDEKYKEFVLKAFVSGIITGYDNGIFNPKGYVTRAEILTLIDRAINEQNRVIPEIVASTISGAPATQTYYDAAVQVRKSSSAKSMNYKLYGKNAQYMTEDDASSGLRLYDEFQGAQGMAFLMRYDLSDIIKREEDLTSLNLVINYNSNGDLPIGLFWYEHKISKTDWNDSSYFQVVNGSAVAADNKMGYNAVCDNIKAIIPTWGDMANAVPQEEKTQPFAQAELKNNRYVFKLSLDELKAHMNGDNQVEFFATTVNYDRYGLDKDNKPRCYTAGAKGPQLYATFETGTEDDSKVTLDPANAELFGGMLNYSDGIISEFKSNQTITQSFNIITPGKYRILINYSANESTGGGTAKLTINDEASDYVFAQTGSWSTYKYEDIGTYEFEAGPGTISISDVSIPGSFLINVKDIILEKVEE